MASSTVSSATKTGHTVEETAVSSSGKSSAEIVEEAIHSALAVPPDGWRDGIRGSLLRMGAGDCRAVGWAGVAFGRVVGTLRLNVRQSEVTGDAVSVGGQRNYAPGLKARRCNRGSLRGDALRTS